MRFFTWSCCKNCNDVCLKRPKINEKEAEVGPFFFKKNLLHTFAIEMNRISAEVDDDHQQQNKPSRVE